MMISLFAPKIQAALAFRESLGKSICNQTTYLRYFDRFCADKYPEESFLTKEIVWDWVYNPFQTKNAVNYRIQAIRFLGKYLTATGEESYIFPDMSANTRRSKFSPYVFTDDELRRFFAAADSEPRNPLYPLQHRIASVAFRLIYTCGLRPNEGRELKCANVNLYTGEILITDTKFQKERIVVMSDDMLALCRNYDRCRNTEGPANSQYFFPAQNGDCHNRKQFNKIFKRCWVRANGDAVDLPSVRIYDLRHRFASAVLNRWVDEKRDLYAMLPYLRAYMGHSDFESTEYYVHLLPENLLKSKGINWSGLESLIPEVQAYE
jgi:integrase/recombinase XerD